ncbi:hypothetical protein SCB49_06717 [unidentified eubacterium SCB49]|nr:hypothetical protein SCB49_06717 [unidentified eubacterium SCB49]
MKIKTTFLLLFLTSFFIKMNAQESVYQDGESLKFRIHYGFVTAGYATLDIEEKTLNNKEVFHIKGYGATTGMSKFFFKVEDIYQSYVEKGTDKPLRFIRKIDEGGYTKDIRIDFDHENQKAIINNYKYDKIAIEDFPKNAQDMVSAFYYLRNNLDTKNIKVGHEEDLNMYFDRGVHKFKMKFLGRETLKTTFGKVPCLKFRPYVEAGRVFKEKESLTVWVSDDENKIPIVIKADLAVGSLKATLSEFRGLKHSFKIIVE